MPGGARSARTPEGPGTGVTSFERLRQGGADDSRLQEGGRHSPCAARPAAVRPTPAVKVPSGPLPKPHGPRLPLRMWEGGVSTESRRTGRKTLPRQCDPAERGAGCRVAGLRPALGLHRPGQPRPLATCSDPPCPLAGPQGTPPRKEPWDS